MKVPIVVMVASLAALGPAANTTLAGDHEWALAGKVLTGVAAVHVLGEILAPRPCVATTAVVYQTPAPVYVAPAPVVYAPPAPTAVATYAPAPVGVQAAPVAATPVAYAPAPTTVVQYVPAPVVVQAAPVYVPAPPVAVYVGAPMVIRPYGVHFHGGHRHRW